ncbi:hypothetical protein FYJ89_07320 [Corynebacterium urealyticum]|nr:hypothetical protein FYJ89_07320 [Corynebacterium urealyticum]
MVWVIAFGELFFGDLWCVVWGYGGMRTHFSLLNPGQRGREPRVWPKGWTYALGKQPLAPGRGSRAGEIGLGPGFPGTQRA